MKNSRYCIFIERKKGKKRWDADKSFANAEVATMKNKVKDGKKKNGNKKHEKKTCSAMWKENVKSKCTLFSCFSFFQINIPVIFVHDSSVFCLKKNVFITFYKKKLSQLLKQLFWCKQGCTYNNIKSSLSGCAKPVWLWNLKNGITVSFAFLSACLISDQQHAVHMSCHDISPF